MNALDSTLAHELPCPDARLLAALPRATRLALEILHGLEGGALAVGLPDGTRLRAGHGPLVAHWRIRDHAVFDMILARSDIGLAQSWMDGAWETDDLTALLRLFAINRERLGRALYGRWWRLLGHRLAHALRPNTRGGARRNIEAHYDLGNDFYALWLDPTMTYSAALFAAPDEPLEAAQRRKYRSILERLDARPGQTLLEIGCGWGGFAAVAADEFGCRVLGVTLSPAQLEWARARAVREGWDALASFELCDYRDVRGHYDHIVSIEMVEAVGERFWPAYFGQLASLLRPRGRCVIQSITIDDAHFARYRRGTDFIQQYVFPGGMLPSPPVVHRHARRAGLAVAGELAFGADYARTLRRWHDAFDARLDEVRALGYSERFLRMWRFYLAYCEAGFDAGGIDVRHFELRHAGAAR
ncbi:MAG TPA: cyclopropane-fatty-acyl-phospholipid synthase family protein [Rhodocyclaceae bacterium]|nr:cyclopropane-fatty-acyl-phospholipid synthase family protein [Rhodocyclaceae bacterium]